MKNLALSTLAILAYVTGDTTAAEELKRGDLELVKGESHSIVEVRGQLEEAQTLKIKQQYVDSFYPTAKEARNRFEEHFQDVAFDPENIDYTEQCYTHRDLLLRINLFLKQKGHKVPIPFHGFYNAEASATVSGPEQLLIGQKAENLLAPEVFIPKYEPNQDIPEQMPLACAQILIEMAYIPSYKRSKPGALIENLFQDPRIRNQGWPLTHITRVYKNVIDLDPLNPEK